MMDAFLSACKPFDLKPQLMMCWCSKLYSIIYVRYILNILKTISKREKKLPKYSQDSFIPFYAAVTAVQFDTKEFLYESGSYCISFLKRKRLQADGIINFPCAIVKRPICREQLIHTFEQFPQNSLIIQIKWCLKH